MGRDTDPFVLTASPSECGFYMWQTTPRRRTRMKTKTGRKYSIDAVVVKGRLGLVDNDPRRGRVLHRLHDAVRAAEIIYSSRGETPCKTYKGPVLGRRAVRRGARAPQSQWADELHRSRHISRAAYISRVYGDHAAHHAYPDRHRRALRSQLRLFGEGGPEDGYAEASRSAS